MKKKDSAGDSAGAALKNIDSYLAALRPEDRDALENLRRIIKKAAPQAEETFSYRMPGFKHGGPLVYYAAFKDHLSLFPASRSVARTLGHDLEPYETSGTTIYFSPEKPLPAALVTKIVKARMAENEARRKIKGA